MKLKDFIGGMSIYTRRMTKLIVNYGCNMIYEGYTSYFDVKPYGEFEVTSWSTRITKGFVVISVFCR